MAPSRQGVSRARIPANRRPLVSVLVPAYNESKTISANLSKICDYLDTLSTRYRWELIVVDDGSNDDTGELAMSFAQDRDGVRVLQHPMNFRLGQALRYGFNECRGDYIVTLDLDLSYSLDHIERMLAKISETRAKIVVASPYMHGGQTTSVPWMRLALSKWGNWFLALTARGLGVGKVSTLTGLVRAYDGLFVQSLNLKSMGMEINTEIIYKALILGARIEEIPAHLDWSHQRSGSSQRVSSKRIVRGVVFGLLAGFIIRPVAFFIVPSLALGLVSLYVMGWIAIHTIGHYRQLSESGTYFDFGISAALAQAFDQSPHAFIVGGITLLLAVQLFSLGILAVQVKQYFEELFHFGTNIRRQSRQLERAMTEATEDPGSD